MPPPPKKTRYMGLDYGNETYYRVESSGSDVCPVTGWVVCPILGRLPVPTVTTTVHSPAIAFGGGSESAAAATAAAVPSVTMSVPLVTPLAPGSMEEAA